MKMLITFLVAVMLCVSINLASAQTLEMAANCDNAQKLLLELIARPDATDAQKIRQELGLDLLDSCDVGGDRVICFQCLDDRQSLRTLQVLQKRDTKRFEFLGFGCRCKDQK